MLVAIALANKIARTMWAMLTKIRIIEFRHRQEQHNIMLRILPEAG